MFQHPKMAHVYVGIDNHKNTHTAVIIDCFFDKLGEVNFENRKLEFRKLLSEVKKHHGKGITPIFGLEDISNYGRELAVFLLEKGFKVKYVNPSLSMAERKSNATSQKSDSLDAHAVARVLLSKLDSLPDAEPTDIHWILNELVTKRRALVRNCTLLKNQLHGLLAHHYPSYKKFFSVFEGKTAMTFWELYPSPSKLKSTSIDELTKLLAKESHWCFTRKKAEEIFALVEKGGDTTNKYQEQKDFIITTSVKQIKENFRIIKEIEEEIKRILPLFGYKLESMKGINSTTAAAIIAEIGDIDRFKNAGSLAAYAGISPAKYSSGQTDKNFSNKQGNRNLHQILFFLAVSLCNDHGVKGGPVNGIFAEYYRKKIAEGKTKKQSIKCVMRRLTSVIFRMMKERTEYRESVIKSPVKDVV